MPQHVARHSNGGFILSALVLQYYQSLVSNGALVNNAGGASLPSTTAGAWGQDYGFVAIYWVHQGWCLILVLDASMASSQLEAFCQPPWPRACTEWNRIGHLHCTP